jgi:DNA-damage-inducible protein D
MNNQLEAFEEKPIRRQEYNGEMYFSVIDVIAVLTDSVVPRNYWATLKKREPQLLTVCQQLKMLSPDGKNYKTDCANTEGVFRIIMSVPSPKAEPLKLWLASVGKQAIEEAENPELLTERQAALYKAKGYPDDWVANRMRTIEVRKELTDEWKQRDVKENQEYSILTATIAKGTFGLNPAEHSELKGLARQNLRDHMTPLELIFTALSEEITKRVTIQNDAQGFNENYEAAQKGGDLAGEARRNLEKKLGETVVSSDNYLGLKGREGASELPE